jgi:hypothetical protein
MKTILFIFSCILIGLNSKAQKSEIIIDSLQTKSSLFSKSLIWVTKSWKNSENVIELKDEASGTIIIKGNLATTNRNHDITKSTITLSVKDGKAKILFENTYLYNPGFTKTYEKPGAFYTKWRDEVSIEIDNLIIDYKKALLTKNDF